MIEVEQKFILTEEQKQKLMKASAFISEKIWTDVYYDTPDFSLLTKDTWLRTRDGEFMVKQPIQVDVGRQLVTQYDEITGEKEISSLLGLPAGASMKEILPKHGFVAIADITTRRRKYKNGEFTIDFDLTDFGYEIVEVELEVLTPVGGIPL